MLTDHKHIATLSALAIALILLLPASVQAQEPAYLLKDFATATVYLKNHTTAQALMNYDASTEKMNFKEDDKLMELTGVDEIDSIVWDRGHVFLAYNGMFLQKQVLKHGTVFVRWRIKSTNVGSKGALGIATQNKVEKIDMRFMAPTATDFDNSTIDVYRTENLNEYYFPYGGKLCKAANKKQLLKIFRNHSREIEQYADEHHLDMRGAEQALTLIDYALSL